MKTIKPQTHLYGKSVTTMDEQTQFILNYFDFSEEKYNNYNETSTQFIKSYFNEPDKFQAKHLYKYLDHLNPHNCPTFWQFGVDKSGINISFQEFCNLLDVDYNDCIFTNMFKFRQQYIALTDSITGHTHNHSSNIIKTKNNGSYYFEFYNRKRTLVFTITSQNFNNGYFHYFNVIGEASAVKNAFVVYNKHSPNACCCWGGLM